jgi:hypothetical protein
MAYSASVELYGFGRVLLCALLGAACQSSSFQAPVLQSVEIQCRNPIGTGPRDIWCVAAAGTPRSIQARHFDGNRWQSILDRPVDVGPPVSAAPAGEGAVWIVSAPGASAASPTLWKLDARGGIEDHSGEFPSIQPGGYGKVVAHSTAVFVNIFDGASFSSFRLGSSGFVQTTTFDAYPIEIFSDHDIWGLGNGALEHFDGTTATSTPGYLSASFGGPTDVWSVNFQGSIGTVGLMANHYDGTTWKPSDVPSDPDPSASIQSAQAVGAGRLGMFLLRSNSTTTDFFGQSWDGSQLSTDRLFYRLNCADCVAGVEIFPPLQDGSVPLIASLWAPGGSRPATFLLSPRAFD